MKQLILIMRNGFFKVVPHDTTPLVLRYRIGSKLAISELSDNSSAQNATEELMNFHRVYNFKDSYFYLEI